MDDKTRKERLAIFQEFIGEKLSDLADFGAKGMCALSFQHDGATQNLATFIGFSEDDEPEDVVREVCASLYSQTEDNDSDEVAELKVVILSVAAMILADNPKMQDGFFNILKMKICENITKKK